MITAIIESGLLASLLCCLPPMVSGGDLAKCLPGEIDLSSLVAVEAQKPSTEVAARETTVKQRLLQLKARCKRGKLVDGKGRQIYFYSLAGCWGNPPADYLDLLKQQEQEIRRLKKRYTVIQILCAQSVDPRTVSQASPK